MVVCPLFFWIGKVYWSYSLQSTKHIHKITGSPKDQILNKPIVSNLPQLSVQAKAKIEMGN